MVWKNHVLSKPLASRELVNNGGGLGWRLRFIKQAKGLRYIPTELEVLRWETSLDEHVTNESFTTLEHMRATMPFVAAQGLSSKDVQALMQPNYQPQVVTS